MHEPLLLKVINGTSNQPIDNYKSQKLLYKVLSSFRCNILINHFCSLLLKPRPFVQFDFIVFCSFKCQFSLILTDLLEILLTAIMLNVLFNLLLFVIQLFA